MLGKIIRKKAEKIIGQKIPEEYSGNILNVKKVRVNTFDKKKGVELSGKSPDGKKAYGTIFPHYTPKAKALRKAAKKYPK